MDFFESVIPIDNIIKQYGANVVFSISTVLFILFVRFLLFKGFSGKASSVTVMNWKRKSYYVTSLVSLFVLFLIWLPHLTTFFTLFSIVGTGLVVVLKEVILNIAGWFYLIMRRPFEIGNRITLQHYSGDVIDIRLLEFSMIEVSSLPEGGQSTGRIIRIPNAMLFTNPLLNASKDFSLCWNEIKIKLSKNSNWKKASTLLETLAHSHLEHIFDSDARLQQAEQKYSIKYNRIDPKVYVTYADESIQLTLRHLSEPKKMRDINDRLWRVILERFKKEKDINFI